MCKHGWSFASKKIFCKEDRTLRCKRLDGFSFIDAFFLTKKHKKSSRDTNCCQLFTTAKDVVFIVPSEFKYEELLTIKHFVKDIEAPYEMLMGTTRKEKFQN